MTPQLIIIIGCIILLILIILFFLFWPEFIKSARNDTYGSNKKVLPERLINDFKTSDKKFKTYKISLTASIEIRKLLQRVDLELNGLKDQVSRNQEISNDQLQFIRNLSTEIKDHVNKMTDIFNESKKLFTQAEIQTSENLLSNYKKALDLLNIICYPEKHHSVSVAVEESLRDLPDINSNAVRYHDWLIDHFKNEFNIEDHSVT